MPSQPIKQRIERKVLAMMTRKDSFPLFSPASGLLAVSWVYGACMHLRRTLYHRGILASYRLPCFVISVGNLILGGTGKTPMVLHLGKLLQDMGLAAAVISRGYKGLHEGKGAVVSDGSDILCDARHAGDEPYLAASLLPGVPVVVGKDRVAAAKEAVKRFHPDVLILDDAFQHLRLQRDLNLLLLDYRKPFGNGYVLPRGTLREPAAAISKADAVILTRCDDSGATKVGGLVEKRAPSMPVFRTRHLSILRAVLPADQPLPQKLSSRRDPDQPSMLAGKTVFAFSGLARNERFLDSIRMFGARIAGSLGFGDHHAYDTEDIGRIAAAALAAECDLLVTTDKDYVRLPPQARFPMALVVLGIAIEFGEDRERWRRFIAQRVENIGTEK